MCSNLISCALCTNKRERQTHSQKEIITEECGGGDGGRVNDVDEDDVV